MKMKNSPHNPWISILKLYMCFEVVCFHFVPQEDSLFSNIIVSQLRLAVPCFAFLSFYLTDKLFKDSNPIKLRERILRLYRPMLIWTFICYVFESIRLHQLISYKEIVCTLVFGDSESGMCKQYWYIIASIVILVFLWVLLNTTESKIHIVALAALICLVFIFEYSGLNSEIFSANRITEVLGRIVEMIPFAASGILFARYKKSGCSYIHTLTLLLFLSILYFLTRNIYAEILLYGGLNYWLLSNIICIIAISLPDILPVQASSLINRLASCTLGVYLIHQTLGRFLKMTTIVPYGTVLFDLLVYVTALLITFTIQRIPQIQHLV